MLYDLDAGSSDGSDLDQKSESLPEAVAFQR